RVLERPADGPAVGDLKPLDVRGDISADTRVDLHVCATRLKVAADLTADRGVRRADDHVAPNSPIAQDRQLVSADDEIVGDLSIDHDRVARRAHTAAHLPADHDAVSTGDPVAGHVAVDADVVASRDQVAVAGPVDRDVRAERVEGILDRLARAYRRVFSPAGP